MANYNNVEFMGNLGQAPDLRHTKDGRPVATLNIASNRVFYDKNDEKQTETCWMRATVWGKKAENAAKYLRKGSGVFVAGRLVNSEYEDDKGIKRYSVDIMAHTVQFLGRPEGGSRAPHPADVGGAQGQRGGSRRGGAPDLPPPPEELPEYDIPF